MKSSSRGGSRAIWLTLHTTEGILTTGGLRVFFDRADATGSSHASADATGSLAEPADGYVPYARAAWTLRNGNPVSENLEMCGFAGWTRPEWLARPALLMAAARWLAKRHAATGIPLERRTPAQVKAREPGVIDHGDYTDGTGDGSHWDVGDNFPWDLVMTDARALAEGRTPTAIYPPKQSQPELQEDDMLTFITDAPDHPWWVFDGSERWYAPPGWPQLLIDTGHAVGPAAVKLVHPNTLAGIPLRDADQVDEAAIAADVAARVGAMTAEQRKALLAAAVPTADYAGGVPATPPQLVLRTAPRRRPAAPLSALEIEASTHQPAS